MAIQPYDKFSVVGSIVEVRIQSPKWSFTKRDDHGRIEFISPLPIFFNYGCIDAWPGADGQPVDALVLGPRLAAGQRIRTRVRAVVQFEDAGRDDSKCVCAAQDLAAAERNLLSGFFAFYATLKRILYTLRGIRGNTRYHGWIIALKEGPTRR